MNTLQLYSALKSQPVTKPYFSGIYSYDTILLIKKKPKLILCNTDPSYMKGEHWVLFYFCRNNTVEFFDPLGKSLKFYGNNFVKFIMKFVKYYCSIKKGVQPIKSSSCGKYCLYYAFLRCKGYKMGNIVRTIPNVSIVSKCVKNKFNICFTENCFENNCIGCVKC